MGSGAVDQAPVGRTGEVSERVVGEVQPRLVPQQGGEVLGVFHAGSGLVAVQDLRLEVVL